MLQKLIPLAYPAYDAWQQIWGRTYTAGGAGGSELGIVVLVILRIGER